jgi:hypothetical protein
MGETLVAAAPWRRSLLGGDVLVARGVIVAVAELGLLPERGHFGRYVHRRQCFLAMYSSGLIGSFRSLAKSL